MSLGSKRNVQSAFVTCPPAAADFDGQFTETVVNGLRPALGVRITVIGARASQASFPLAAGSCILGSGPDADLVISDRSVSRSHVELSIVNGGISVRDLGSRNGTYYLGNKVERITLPRGASLRIGGATVFLEVSEEQGGSHVFEGTELRGMLGVSLKMRRLFTVLKRLDGARVPVLVNGESGVGKELVARALHEGSGVTGPLVSFNCGAIARELVMSELFGHKRGAFTGATDARRGAFDAAEGGTLFLDEIGELPLEVQPALLRVLECGEVRQVGNDSMTTVNVRIVAATHRDLEKEVREGRFREDLYYRLAVIKLEVPPLRERTEDIPLLAARFAAATGAGPLPGDLVEKLKERPWPGNARELRNVIQAWAVLGNLPAPPKPVLGSVDASLASLVDVARPYSELKDDVLERFQRVYLTELLTSVKGNQTAAAKLAGMDRTYLGRLLVRLGLNSSGDPAGA